MMLPSMNIEQGEILFEFLKTEEEMFTQDGYDILKVSFRTNKKSEFNSIKKVASGGELSRLLLIIKSISAKFDKNLTLIFDEVDSGLSGKIADNVSKKIYELSKNNQIIAITHSAQVASKADSHWKIEKKIKNDDMQSNISLLDDQGRILEIASLISGTNVTDETKIVAQNLINHKNES
jgi:DNA repair protein RecN (Recombination protein N)